VKIVEIKDHSRHHARNRPSHWNGMAFVFGGDEVMAVVIEEEEETGGRDEEL
jgi:hypothetical protein